MMGGHFPNPPAADATTRDGLDALLDLARELTTMTSLARLRDALQGPLRALLPSRDIVVLRAAHGFWEALIGPEDAPDRIHEYFWTSLSVDGATVGMLGVGAPSGSIPDGRTADAATLMLAAAVQHIITLDNVRLESVRDSLTGCYNRAHALEVLDGHVRRASRTGLPVSVMMIDVDGFKQINDSFGHVPGDAVLAAVAARLHGMLRRSDVRCRFGGDEFLVILPDTSLDDALRVAESVRHAIEEMEVTSTRGPMRITSSIGVATTGSGASVDLPGFIDRADVALYRAKQAGRNCVQACATSSARVPHTRLRLAARPA